MLRKSLLAFLISFAMGTPSAVQAVNADPAITQVGLGFSHACAVGGEGDLWCWGSNSDKQVGQHTDAYRLTPTKVEGVSGVTSVALAESSTCALLSYGQVQCWGSALSGQLGNGGSSVGDSPAAVWDLTGAVKISAGRRHYCVITVDELTWCWGQNNAGQVTPLHAEMGFRTTFSRPTTVYTLPQAIDIAVGDSHSCALTAGGKVWCWGANDQGQSGDGSVSATAWPAEVPGLDNVTAIAAQLYGTCALNASHEVWCWGYNNEGELGIGRKSLREASPIKIQGIGIAERIWARGFNTCVQNSLAEVYCWGSNFSGQVGSGDVAEHLSPIKLSVLSNIQTLGIGFGTTCAIAVGETIWCWGGNNFGQVGNGTRTERYLLMPTQAFPPVLDIPTTPQIVSFDSIPNRTTTGARTFTVSATADSTLPVNIEGTSGVCSADGLEVTIWDIGTCTLTASQQGYGSFLPATSVVRQFAITRTMLLNKTLSFLDADGVPASGVSVSWLSLDGTYASSKATVTNAAGKITYSSIPGGKIRFTVTGKVSGWSGGDRITELVMGSAVSVNIPVSSLAGDSFSTLFVQVQLPDGSPVPKARVFFEADCGRGNWILDSCKLSKAQGVFTSTNGTAELTVPKCYSLYGDCRGVWVVFDDGEVSQRSGTVALNERGEAVIELEQLPVVDIETNPATINYGAAQTVTAIARNSDGSPIAGRALTLSASTSGASASCSGRKTTATTNSAGRATFKVCPVKTAVWSVDGRSIVGSSGVRLTVQLTPTAPRTLATTAKTRSVSLAWVAPVKANASAVSDYVVQYRLQGSSTWNTFRDGTSTACKATVTGLTSGQIYEFRVAAKNKSGVGTWSDLVLGTSN